MGHNILLDLIKNHNDDEKEVILKDNRIGLKSVIIKRCKGTKVRKMLEDMDDYILDLLIECVVSPVLNEDAVLNVFKVKTDVELVDEIFEAGEQKMISDEILKISGLGKAREEAREEAKK